MNIYPVYIQLKGFKNKLMEHKIKKIHAFTDDALGQYDAIGLSKLLKAKEISVFEVIDASIKRAKLVNPVLNAIASESFELDLKQRYELKNHVFSGIPIFIKDNLDLVCYPTQHGSKAFQSDIKQKNSKITQQILDSGFIALGKSKLPEFGLNASTEFKDGSATKNPWNLDYSCGASSGGSAALVAAGVVPIAHANDGGGSIRIPAANCGLVGLKPTRGRLKPNEASHFLPIDLISDGVLTRSVRDTAHFFHEMEKIYHHKKLPPISLVEHGSGKRLKIGLVLNSIYGETDGETQNVVIQTAHLLEHLGHVVEPFQFPIPETFVADFSHYWGFLAFMLEQMGRPLFGKHFKAAELDHLSQGLSKLYKRNIHKTPVFIYRLRKIQNLYRSIFKNYDLILSPVLAHTSPKLGYLSPELPFDLLFERLQNYVTYTPIQNIAGAPALSLPMGMTSEDQRPIGVQLSADLGMEGQLLSIAYELEEIQPFRHLYAL